VASSSGGSLGAPSAEGTRCEPQPGLHRETGPPDFNPDFSFIPTRMLQTEMSSLRIQLEYGQQLSPGAEQLPGQE